jgi:hypothetical protein
MMLSTSQTMLCTVTATVHRRAWPCAQQSKHCSAPAPVQIISYHVRGWARSDAASHHFRALTSEVGGWNPLHRVEKTANTVEHLARHHQISIAYRRPIASSRSLPPQARYVCGSSTKKVRQQCSKSKAWGLWRVASGEWRKTCVREKEHGCTLVSSANNSPWARRFSAGSLFA